MTSKYHTATFTESAFLDELGMGDEMTTHVKGSYTGTLDTSSSVKKNPYLSITEKTIMDAKIGYNGKAIKLQQVFDSVHAELPIKSFTLQELTMVREVKEFDDYLLRDEYLNYELRYHTFGLKTGVFKRYGATITPCELFRKKLKKRKTNLKDKIPKKVYMRVKDCILLNDNTYSVKDLRKLFLDFPYIMMLEEKEGIFYLKEFTEI